MTGPAFDRDYRPDPKWAGRRSGLGGALIRLVAVAILATVVGLAIEELTRDSYPPAPLTEVQK